MPLILIIAISPILLFLSFAFPFISGVYADKKMNSVVCGWVLFVMSFIFQDVFSVLLARKFHGVEAASVIAVDQPGIFPAFLIGWILPLIAFYVGQSLKLIGQFVTRIINK